jgi:hypothetical protein
VLLPFELETLTQFEVNGSSRCVSERLNPDCLVLVTHVLYCCMGPNPHKTAYQ